MYTFNLYTFYRGSSGVLVGGEHIKRIFIFSHAARPFILTRPQGILYPRLTQAHPRLPFSVPPKR